ncbi:ABC transporter substrate-binding protein [Micrococcaceae sp. AOP34-BR2-30]|uniref:ABC transporter substrate-binding protein n=1 Tax=Flaviflexus sp. TaxID=1969482 RepID=UPI003F91B4D8
MITSIARKRLIATMAAVIGVAVALTGCTTAAPDTDDTTAPAAEAGAFPVTVDAAYGAVTVPEKPERIVALGGQTVDVLISIGVQPAIFAEAGAYSNEPNEETLIAQYPWLEGQYTGELRPEISGSDGKASVEAIAALEPDLIIAGWWNVDEQIYGQLSAIAPTFVGLETDQNTDWGGLVESLGTLTGESGAASETLANVESTFATAAERLHGLQGKTYNSVAFSAGTGEFRFPGRSYLEDLGLQAAENQGIQTANDQSFSLENLEELDADVLLIGIWGDPNSQATLEADPRLAGLPAYKNETLLWNDFQQAVAENSPGPMSLSWLLEQVVPVLEKSALNNSQ